MASKWGINEEGHIYYINIDLLSYVRNIDVRNINVWILGGCMTQEKEFNVKVEEIKQKIMSLGSGCFAEGYEKGYTEGARNQDEVQYKHGYEKGLEDMWEACRWYLNNDLETLRSIFPEHKPHEAFVVMCKRVGLAESVRRIKEYNMKADTRLLYSTISDLKADYTKEQIVKALKDNGIEVIEVNK